MNKKLLKYLRKLLREAQLKEGTDLRTKVIPSKKKKYRRNQKKYLDDNE